jgi:hypothetical protein
MANIPAARPRITFWRMFKCQGIFNNDIEDPVLTSDSLSSVRLVVFIFPYQKTAVVFVVYDN